MHIASHKQRTLKYRAKNGIRMKDPSKRHCDIDGAFLFDLWKAQQGLCAVSGLEMTYRFNDPQRISIDRIDSKRGYIRDNVQLVCQFVNLAKSQFTDQQIRDVFGKIKAN